MTKNKGEIGKVIDLLGNEDDLTDALTERQRRERAKKLIKRNQGREEPPTLEKRPPRKEKD